MDDASRLAFNVLDPAFYVDPWDARWLSPRGSFVWDTRSVPNGDYYLFAVIDPDPGAGPQRQRASNFKIAVKH